MLFLFYKSSVIEPSEQVLLKTNNYINNINIIAGSLTHKCYMKYIKAYMA